MSQSNSVKVEPVSDRAVRILISGAVQGCGVRPEIARLAKRMRWSGMVRNSNAGVEVALSGSLPTDQELYQLIMQAVPPQAIIDNICIRAERTSWRNGFSIEESSSAGIFAAPIPRDVAICSDCLAETRNPQNRRYRYPFTSCASCGPRYSILHSMPFDRSRTTMHRFALCENCFREYEDPTDRRFHAQTICCPDCGPRTWLTDGKRSQIASGDDAMCLSAEAILDGQIVAMRGVGGYQLLADATNSNAISRLRKRKGRPEKPLAVMCRDLVEAGRLTGFGQIEREQLIAAHNPILLVRQRRDTGVCAEVNPGLNQLGVLLPSTAMHDRLLELVNRPLVCTSGNSNGDPIVFGIDEAVRQLDSVADLFLHHDREILHPIDDSVVRVIAGRAVTFRCGRGLAPMYLRLNSKNRLIAVGGQLKASVAASNGELCWLGPHIGNLDQVSVQRRWIEELRFVDQQLPHDSDDMKVVPQRHELDQFVHDAHPDFFSTVWCSNRSQKSQIVWHHHAHVVSGMLEHQWLDRTVLGVAFDGTGVGPDGTIWGGEFLIANASRFQRIGHLRLFELPGGEAAIVDTRRILFSLLSQIEGVSERLLLELTRLSTVELSRYRKILNLPTSIRTSSCGRLFDAIACLILEHDRSTFDGQPAMRLECSCDPNADGEYTFPCEASPLIEIDWRPVLTQIIEDRRRQVSAGTISMRFHRGLARTVVNICERHRELPVVFSGGVFQNRVLAEQISELWPKDRAPPGLPGLIPPNDGGLAAGQLAVSAMRSDVEEK